MPLSVLSYASVLGIVSTVFLVVVMFVDGFSKRTGPGSLWSPADTSLSFGSLGQLGLSFGLFMAGVSDALHPHSQATLTRFAVVWPRRYSFIGA